LKNPGEASAEVFSKTLASINAAVVDAKKKARKAQADAFDPAVLDATAIGRLHDTEYRIQRLENAEKALAPLHVAAVKKEEQAAWAIKTAHLRQRAHDLRQEFPTSYQRLVTQLADLLALATDTDREIAVANLLAPPGMGMVGVGRAEIIGKVRLPSLSSNIDAWPPRQHISLEYSEMIMAGLRGARPLTEAERAEAAARHIAHGIADERAREARRGAGG
jgi:hypothetical protein